MKNNVWIFIVLVGLFIAFAVVSVLVYFTDGKNARLLKRKLAIGASIIALTGVFNGCRPVVTCYDVAPSPVVTCTDSVNNNGEIVIDNTDKEIRFDMMYGYYENVSFRILSGQNMLVTDSCVMVQDTNVKRITVNLPNALTKGNYTLGFYYFKPDQILDEYEPFYSFNLKVINL